MTNHSLALLLDFDACAQRDDKQTSVFLHRRDRKFALTCQQQGLEPNAQRWLAHINHLSGDGEGASASEQSLRFWQRINRGFMATGTLLGLLSMIGLLFYDGGQRINVTVIIAFVAFQLLLAILTTVQSIAGWQPWRAVLRRFQSYAKSEVSIKLQPVLMARSAQLGGLCFTLAGLATLMVMVVLQDLAFGWSTTLETDASTYHQIVSIMATPWAWLWPSALPDFSLVEATRFFRANTEQGNINPEQWGQWWPFIAMLWTTWAMLPRLMLYILANFVIKRKAKRLLANHPSMRALMYRMETPTLDTGNEHNDAADLPNTNTQLSLQPLPDANIVLCWAGAGDPQLPAVLSSDKSIIAKVGGRMSLNQDQQTIEQVAKQLRAESSRRVLVITRAWEPPTGELEDFLAKAKELWPKNTHVILVPLATHVSRQPDNHQVQQWLRFTHRIGPEHVSVSLLPKYEGSSNIEQGVKL